METDTLLDHQGGRLLDLALKYGTDKVGHGYIPAYARHLPNDVRSLLEIGVLKGASAKMFDEYYGHKPDVHLLDLFEEPGNLTEREARALGFVPHRGSQTNLGLLSTICSDGRKFDFITEDASHNSADQIITFKYAFEHMLNSGGLYVIEDLHCNHEPFYWSDKIKSFEDTPLHMFRYFIEKGRWYYNPYFTYDEVCQLEAMIDTVTLECDDKIVFVKKK